MALAVLIALDVPLVWILLISHNFAKSYRLQSLIIANRAVLGCASACG